jgi:hypothetical protein
MKKNFYICSYGGSGSTMLANALRKLKVGIVEHIHSRKPPNKLEYIGKKNGGNVYCEWFNGIPIPEAELENYYVIYIYRNPVYSILSRFHMKAHLEHIQVNKNIKLQEVLNKEKDLYKIKEFYNNYTTPNDKRNYKIIAVKYEDLFDKQDELSELLGIDKLNLVNKSTRKNTRPKLNKIYKDLIETMNKNPFIMTI